MSVLWIVLMHFSACSDRGRWQTAYRLGLRKQQENTFIFNFIVYSSFACHSHPSDLHPFGQLLLFAVTGVSAPLWLAHCNGFLTSIYHDIFLSHKAYMPVSGVTPHNVQQRTVGHPGRPINMTSYILDTWHRLYYTVGEISTFSTFSVATFDHL